MKKGIGLLLLSICTIGVFSQDSIWLGRTKGKYPFLEYGIGDERLGGAKIGYLDSNVALSVVDSFATDYKVRLSTNHSAYIAKESVTLIKRISNAKVIHNPLLTGSLKVFGDSLFDYVVVSLPEALPYRSEQLLDPSRIVVDVFGVNNNTNWLNQLNTSREIRNTWCEQPEDDVFRINIELRHHQHWGHSIAYDSLGKKLTIRVKRQPAVLDIRKLSIAIDAGHGGDNSGTSGLNGTVEKEYTLIIARELEKNLRKAGAKKIFMTRTKDTSLSMVERLDMLKQFNPDYLISIHLNAANTDTVQGVSTYYRYLGFRPLSVALLNQLLALGLKEYGNVGSFNFALSGPTDYPNALVEVAFLSHPADEKKVRNPKFQQAVAQRIAAGIKDWLKLAAK